MPLPQSLAEETALCIQHVSRVTDALRNNTGGGWAGHTQVALYWLTNADHLPHIRRAHAALGQDYIPTLFLVVKDLPKDALVEKQVLFHTGRCMIPDEDDGEVSLQSRHPIYEQSMKLYYV